MVPGIYIAFRFHGNFYHSYRGDTPDELGFGKDIRIIRSILQTLDDFNQRGVPVCGTWDFENYFSLEKIMPIHCPDIIAAFQRRAEAGLDEFQLMSYNNGFINAHTAREFEAAMQRAITNPAGSGLRDLFGAAFADMVRPQEMMFSPIHLKLYKALGINAISLYYSGLPFNGFSNFIPPLNAKERYNPLTLAYPDIAETMTLMPAYNVGDVADHLTLRRWVKQMRRQQLQMAEPCDLLLLIDQDADDEFWYGFNAPAWLKKSFATANGLPALVNSLLDLDYVHFTTPCRYLEAHLPVKTVIIGQDTADGSFDGLSSWTEKWVNHRLFTGLMRSRLLTLQAQRLAGSNLPEIQPALEAAFETRLKILSTTHFGMASPVMNRTREHCATAMVRQAFDSAASAFSEISPPKKAGQLCLIDYVRGESTQHIHYQSHASKALIRLPLQKQVQLPIAVQTSTGLPLASVVLEQPAGRQLVFIDQFAAKEEKTYCIMAGQPAFAWAGEQVQVDHAGIKTDQLDLRFDGAGQVVSLALGGQPVNPGRFLSSGITYANKTYQVASWETIHTHSTALVGGKIMRGEIALPGGFTAIFEREILVAAGLPYLYVTMSVTYPRTPDKGYDKEKALRLQRKWDNNWQSVTPCEINPPLIGSESGLLRIWKHNFCDHVSMYPLDYGNYSNNKTLHNINNHITNGWVAVSNGCTGLLLAQSANFDSNVAFCPMRTHSQGKSIAIQLNPFGSYTGRQYHYNTADSGLGYLLSTRFSASDHIKPYAPSYNGRRQCFSLMIAPYVGDAPPEAIQHDAAAFASPYIVLKDDAIFTDPGYMQWQEEGLED